MKTRIILADHWFDFRYRVDTCRRESLENLQVGGENRRRGNRYEPSRVLPVQRFFEEMRTQWPEPPVLVDMGCGKGRVLMIAAMHGFAAVKGVEFARELYDAAKKNVAKFMRATGTTATTFDIMLVDAADYKIAPQENVFFFFNPFDDVVMSQVLANLERSWQQLPRRILICCYNQPSTEQFDQLRLFHRCSEYDFWGYHFVVYQSQASTHAEALAESATAEQQ